MTDPAAALEDEAGGVLAIARSSYLAHSATIHRPRLHDQIVIGPEEAVGNERLDPGSQRIPFEVAGQHAQFAGNGVRTSVNPLDQRAVRHHRLEARQFARAHPSPRHLAEEAEQFGHDRQPGPLEYPAKDR